MEFIDLIIEKFYEGGWPVMLSIFLTLVVSIVIVTERVIRYWTRYDLAKFWVIGASTWYLGEIKKNLKSQNTAKS